MADGSRHSLYEVGESTFGQTPTNPALNTLRITGTTLGLTKEPLQSEEIRADRQIADFRLGSNQVAGDINFELSYGSLDQLLQTVLLSAVWGAPATTGTTTLSATVGTFTRAAGSFVSDGFLEGQTITSSGFINAGNNGKWRVDGVTATVLTVTSLQGNTQVVESGDADELISASEASTGGITRSSHTLVRYFSDILEANEPYHIYRGVEFNALQLTIAASAIVTGTLTAVGQSLELTQNLNGLGTPTYTPISTTSPVDSFTGTLEEGGSTIAVVTELSLNLQNTLAPRFVVGDKDSLFPSVGRSNLTGQLTAYFDDSTLVRKFLDETNSSLAMNLPDADGNVQRWTIPNLKYTGGQPDVAGEGPITLAMPFQAILSATEGTNIIIERTPA